MRYAGLSLEQTPPLSVPTRFFLTAPLFGVAFAGLLLWAGPAALATRWSPVALAATHLLTLGFLGMVMFGAMLQLLPVLVGSPVARPRAVSALLHILLTLGTLLLVGGLLGDRAMIRLAVPVLATAFGCFLWVAARGLWHSTSRHASVRTMALAVIALGGAVGLGLYLAAGHGWGLGTAPRVTDVHAAWALLGWMGLLVVGVGYQVVPMFQITPEYPRPLMRWLGVGILTVLALWGLVAAAPWRPPGASILEAVTAGLLAVGVAAYALATLHVQRHRRRRLPDVTLLFWGVAMASALLAVALWLAGRVHPAIALAPAYPLALGVLAIVGFGVSIINGMLYKIVPFLVWLHLQRDTLARGERRVRVPNMKEVIPELRMRRQLWVHVFALALLGAAPWWPILVYPAALSFGASCLLLWFNLASGLQLYRRVTAQTGPHAAART
jgi:hypothetical protein